MNSKLTPIIEELSVALGKIKESQTKPVTSDTPPVDTSLLVEPVVTKETLSGDPISVNPVKSGEIVSKNPVTVKEKAQVIPSTIPINNDELNQLMSQCKNNIKNKNMFIDIFMNHFLNCNKIVKHTQPSSSQETLDEYFTELFNYSNETLEKIKKYEKFTSKFQEYINDPEIFKVLEGFTISNVVTRPELNEIEVIPRPLIFNTQPEYNSQINIKNVEQPEPLSIKDINDPFEESIYNYIDKYIGAPSNVLNLKKFDIVNSIINLDKGIIITGEGGASSNVITAQPVVIAPVVIAPVKPTPVKPAPDKPTSDKPSAVSATVSK